MTKTVMTPQILAELRTAVGDRGLIQEPNQLQTYECDGLTNFRALPGAVVLPRTTAEVQAAVRVCAKHKIAFVARGAGTGGCGQGSSRRGPGHEPIRSGGPHLIRRG